MSSWLPAVPGRTAVLTVVVAVLMLALVGAVLVPGGHAPGRVGGAPAASSSTHAATSTTPLLPHLIVDVTAANKSMDAYVNATVLPRLAPGDTLVLTHDPSNPVTASTVSQINAVASAFASAGPRGMAIAVLSGYVAPVGALANGSKPPISAVGATAEPNGATPGLPYTLSGTLAYFNEVASLAHARGLASVAYPTGSFLLNGGLLQYGWNYGRIAATSDQMWVELQGYTEYPTTTFTQAINKLISQVNGSGQPLSKVAIQIILGNPSLQGVTPSVALQDIQIAQAAGINNIDLWTTPGYDSYLGTTVANLQRTSPPVTNHSVTVAFSESGLPAGSQWNVTVDGRSLSSTNTSQSLTVTNGTYHYAVDTPVPVAANLRYVAQPSNGTVNVSSPTNVTVRFLPQALLVLSAVGPGSVSLAPSSNGWYLFGSSVTFSASPSPHTSFLGWNGSGNGSYSGSANPLHLTVSGPVVEVATFVANSSPPPPSNTSTPVLLGFGGSAPELAGAVLLPIAVAATVLAMSGAVRVTRQHRRKR